MLYKPIITLPLSQTEDVLAFHLKHGEIRPKNEAFTKLTFIMFIKLDTTTDIEQEVWQEVTSLTYFLAPALRGMTSFRDPFRDLIGKSKSDTKRKTATATCKLKHRNYRYI